MSLSIGFLPILPISCVRSAGNDGRYSRRPNVQCAAQPPRRIAAVARDMQEALQTALRSRLSRSSVELPPGARLGTEKRDGEQSKTAGDRELTRILAGMFEGTELSVRVMFSSAGLAKAAKKMWGPLIECEVSHWDEVRSKKKGVKKAGFGKAAAESQFDDDIDVLLVVDPTPAQMKKVQQLSKLWGMDKLIILLNCNLEKTKAPVDIIRYFNSEFESVYCYRPNPHPLWSGAVLFRKFPDDWVLCRQPPIGFLQQILCQEEKPSLDEIAEAMKQEGEKPATGIINKLTSFLGND